VGKLWPALRAPTRCLQRKRFARIWIIAASILPMLLRRSAIRPARFGPLPHGLPIGSLSMPHTARPGEPNFSFWNNFSTGVLTNRPHVQESTTKSQQFKMIKSLAAFAIFALSSAVVMALPGFSPILEAGEITALAKADKLDVRNAAPDCVAQVWPDFAASCLRNTGSAAKVMKARLVTTRRQQ